MRVEFHGTAADPILKLWHSESANERAKTMDKLLIAEIKGLKTAIEIAEYEEEDHNKDGSTGYAYVIRVIINIIQDEIAGLEGRL